MKTEKDLKEKLEELAKLVKTIKLYGGKLLTSEQKGKYTELRDRLEFRLGELLLHSKIEEADVKIDIFKQVVELIRNP